MAWCERWCGCGMWRLVLCERLSNAAGAADPNTHFTSFVLKPCTVHSRNPNQD